MIPDSLIPLLFLAIGSLEDLRTRRIRLSLLAAAALAGILSLLFLPGHSPSMLVTSLLPGVMLLGISYCSREGIGSGDALTVLVLGLFYRFEAVLMILLAGLFLAALYAGAVFLKKGRGNDAFPFLPFLLASLVLFLIVTGGKGIP